MSNQILCVDDDANILSALQRGLRKRFSIHTALGGEEALSLVRTQGPFAVVVADMQMPSMNGVQLLAAIRQLSPDTVRIMLTGNADQQTAVEAVNRGQMFQFLTKPCPVEMLANAVDLALAQHRLITADRELLEKTLNGSIKVLTEILSMMDPASFGQAQQLRDYVQRFARPLGVAQTWDLELAAMLAQIGRVTIPTVLLEKAKTGAVMTGAEKDLLIRMPQIGAALIRNIPRLESVAGIVLYQNKNFDGSGFPADALAGEAIPMGSRILKVLTDLLSLAGSKLPRFKALERMRQSQGRYDPQVLEAVAASLDVALGEGATGGTVTQVAFKELRVGDILSSEVRTTDGTMIVAASTEISDAVMRKLANFAELSGIKEPIHVLR
jgi:response regulator RpfG family c-di-GMP phosphodiesterase